MALVEVNANFEKVAAALERIASALETIAEVQVDPQAAVRIRAAANYDPDRIPAPEALGINTDESLWEHETVAAQNRDTPKQP